MPAGLDWIQRSDWSQRGPEFGGLRVLQVDGGAVVAMEFAPSAAIDVPELAPLWHRAPLVLDDDAAAMRLATWRRATGPRRGAVSRGEASPVPAG